MKMSIIHSVISLCSYIFRSGITGTDAKVGRNKKGYKKASKKASPSPSPSPFPGPANRIRVGAYSKPAPCDVSPVNGICPSPMYLSGVCCARTLGRSGGRG